MGFFAEAASAADAAVEAIEAYCFSDKELFLAIQATDEDEEITGSALLRVPLESPAKFELLDEFDTATLNYWARDRDTHFLQASGRCLRRVSRGRVSTHPFDHFGTSLMNMTGTSDGTVIVYGDEGVAQKLVDDDFIRVPTNLSKNLHAMHMNAGGMTAAGGNFGAFAIGPIGALQQRDIGVGGRITKLRVREDGSVAIAVKGGAARELRDGQIVTFDAHDEPWSAIAEFRGEELWGDEDYGVFLRRGTTFIPVFETGAAIRMNASASHLVITSSNAVRLFDGERWRSFEVQADPEQPIVAAELDFDPNWPV